MVADWSQTTEHIARHGVTPVQANEALADPERVEFAPTTTAKPVPAFAPSVSRPARTLFYQLSPSKMTESSTAQLLSSRTAATVVTTAKEDQMSKSLADRLAEAAAEAEAAEGDQTVRPLPAHVKVSQPGLARSKVLQIRLNPDELAAVEAIAERRGLPVSTVGREQILRMITADTETSSGEEPAALVGYNDVADAFEKLREYVDKVHSDLHSGLVLIPVTRKRIFRSDRHPGNRRKVIAMAERNSREVVPNPDGGWDVKKPGASKSSGHFDTQAGAVDRAREILLKDGGGELRTHGRDGKIRSSDTIGRKDPRRTKG